MVLFLNCYVFFAFASRPLHSLDCSYASKTWILSKLP